MDTTSQFCDFQCVLFLLRQLNLYERALSGNEQLPFIKTFVREFIQCRTSLSSAEAQRVFFFRVGWICWVL